MKGKNSIEKQKTSEKNIGDLKLIEHNRLGVFSPLKFFNFVEKIILYYWMEFLIQVDEAHSKVDIICIIEVKKWARNLYCFHILLDVVKS